MYKAIIQQVEKREDEIIIKIEFSNETETFEKEYRFVHMVDINTSFEETVKNELKRMDDLEAGYKILKLKIGQEIKKVK